MTEPRGSGVVLSRPIRVATAADIGILSVCLARAFATDPVQRWMMPGPGRYRRMVRLFRVLLGVQVELGRTYTTADGVGAAIWAPPDRWRLDPGTARTLAEGTAPLLGSQLDRAIALQQTLDDHHPDGPPHWYLAALGTHPDWQRRGVGATVMQPVLACCDDEGVPAYLESSKEQNVPYYRRHGFEVTETIDVPGGGPRLWGMWREPR